MCVCAGRATRCALTRIDRIYIVFCFSIIMTIKSFFAHFLTRDNSEKWCLDFSEIWGLGKFWSGEKLITFSWNVGLRISAPATCCRVTWQNQRHNAGKLRWCSGVWLASTLCRVHSVAWWRYSRYWVPSCVKLLRCHRPVAIELVTVSCCRRLWPTYTVCVAVLSFFYGCSYELWRRARPFHNPDELLFIGV